MSRVEYEKIPIEKISLDLENPRIAQYVQMYGDDISSEAIALALSASSGAENTSTYSALKESIRVNGGIINPIIVNRKTDGQLVVIEGNTRLQIYKEFQESNPDGPWNEIIAVVYDDLPPDQIHAIRLQSHLVGPRDWDPFSKAKYLYQLSEIDYLPMEKIISFCGGKKTEIQKFISAYKDMTKYYTPVVEAAGMDFDPRDFSKFAELQKASVINALITHSYTKEDFAKWVLNQNIDTAQNVRKIPAILNNKKAHDEFLRTNVSSALKYLVMDVNGQKGLKDASMDDLVMELTNRIQTIQFSEVKRLRNAESADEERANILTLYDELKALIDDLEVDSDE